MLGLCWVIWGSAGGFRAAKKTSNGNIFCWRFFWGRFWAYVGPFGGYVGPLLGHFRAMLGLCWVIWGSAGGFRAEKTFPNRKFFGWEIFWVGFGLMLAHLEAMLGLCWAILGLCWTLSAALGLKKSTPTEAWFGWGWILGWFWAYVGPFVEPKPGDETSAVERFVGRFWFYKIKIFLNTCWALQFSSLVPFFPFSTYPRHAGFNLLHLDFSFSERGVGTAFHLLTFSLLIP